MDAPHRHYDVSPKVVPAGSECDIRIRPLQENAAFDPGCKWEVMAVSREQAVDRTGDHTVGTRPQVRVEDGTMVIRCRLDGEQEHRFHPRGTKDEHTVTPGSFNVYSVAPDLYSRRPWKGDPHLHTTYSDGRASPADVTARCREVGLDFMAIADQGKYAPSLEAIASFKDSRADLRIYPGEEVHPPGNWVHMVNFGGAFSVNELIARDDKDYRQAVADKEKTLTGLDGLARHQYASCKWCYDQIRRAGGLAILCHPHGNFWHAYNLSELEMEKHFAEWPCDALELIGGCDSDDAECNVLQVARYHEARMKYRRDFPVVGASDARMSDEKKHVLGWFYTIVFSPTAELADVIASIKAGYSAAVESAPGQKPRIHGTYRMVKYACFVLQELFVLHDELCVEEGRLMREHAVGSAAATSALAGLSGRTAKAMEHWWNQGDAARPG